VAFTSENFAFIPRGKVPFSEQFFKGLRLTFLRGLGLIPPARNVFIYISISTKIKVPEKNRTADFQHF
jgi:hypothetical protein